MKYAINAKLRDALINTEKFLSQFEGSRVTTTDQPGIAAHLDQLAVAVDSVRHGRDSFLTAVAADAPVFEIADRLADTHATVVRHLTSLLARSGREPSQDDTLNALSLLRALLRDTMSAIREDTVDSFDKASRFGVRALLVLADEAAALAADKDGYKQFVKIEETDEKTSTPSAFLSALAAIMCESFVTGDEAEAKLTDVPCDVSYCSMCRGTCKARAVSR